MASDYKKLLTKNKMAEASVIAEGSVLEEEDKTDYTVVPDYTEEEKTYIGNLQTRLEHAKDTRDQTHVEFDNLNYISYWWANERGANTYLKHKENKGDPTFQSGTLRTKLLSFLSTFQGLNLMPDITAFDKSELPISVLGEGMEDIMEKCGELENDEEKRMLRQYELLKHGTVYVEDTWNDRYIVEKTVSSSFQGTKESAKWTTAHKKSDSRPIRNIVPGTAVYLGDMTKYLIEDQPFIFTLQVMRYEEAEQTYGKWDMWKHVSKQKSSFANADGDESISNAWRLSTDAEVDKVEVIKYQDKTNNEFQIILNGIPMLPMGYPLTEISPDGEYTITQQNLEPIRHTFSMGKSFIFKNKNLVAVLDKMMQLGVLKTYKSYMPAYINTSDRVLSRDVFSPGKITRGIQPGQLQPLSEHEAKGVTNSELAMIQEMIRTVDQNTVSQTTTGAKEQGGDVTATQIMQLQRQAKIMMGLVVLSAALLEKKLAHKRLALILKNWFEPIDQVANATRSAIKSKYRTTSIERSIEGKGQGMRMVIPTEKIPKPEQIKELEKEATKRMGVPIKMIMLNPKQIKKAKLIWVININPKEKKTSEFNRLMFAEMTMGAINLGLPVDPNWLMERYAQVWEEDAGKMFSKGKQPVAPEETDGTAAQGIQGATQGQKGVKEGIKPKAEETPAKGLL